MPGGGLALASKMVPQVQRESSLLTTYWSESTIKWTGLRCNLAIAHK